LDPVYLIPGGRNVEIEPRQRNALIAGALVGAVLGAGAGWLLAQPVAGDSGEPKKQIRPGDVLKLVKNAAGLLRQVDDLRHQV
jgi:gas vesicle protein